MGIDNKQKQNIFRVYIFILDMSLNKEPFFREAQLGQRYVKTI